MGYERILSSIPITGRAEAERRGAGRGLEAARTLGPAGIVEHVSAAGLRGRGGAGFPTGRKWAAVCAHASRIDPATVVVNAAEGEPGSFKDRAIVRRNPWAVVEGALIAATAVGANRVVIGVKQSFERERAALEGVIGAARDMGWTDGIDCFVFAGPAEYLYGEETALLEAIDGRPPFPRIAPPYRHGVEEDLIEHGGEPAGVVMAEAGTDAAPTLVNNAETIANVPGILAHGPRWFREVGTVESPGTIVCTVSGSTRRAGVGEFPMGTPLREVITELGGGAQPERRLVAAMSGVANPVLTEDQFDTPVSYEGMTAIGSGLGAAGFIAFDDSTDVAAVAHGVSRFLAVESCGQCTPCKQDGLALCDLLDRIRCSEATEDDRRAVADRLGTITDGARCFLAQQHQRVVSSILSRFPEEIRAHVDGTAGPAPALLIAPIQDYDETRSSITLDHAQRDKQPDWTFNGVDSGKAPAERLATGGTVGPPAVPPVVAPAASRRPRSPGAV